MPFCVGAWGGRVLGTEYRTLGKNSKKVVCWLGEAVVLGEEALCTYSLSHLLVHLMPELGEAQLE